MSLGCEGLKAGVFLNQSEREHEKSLLHPFGEVLRPSVFSIGTAQCANSDFLDWPENIWRRKEKHNLGSKR